MDVAMRKNRTRRRATFVRAARPTPGWLLFTLVMLSIALGELAYAYVLVVWGGR